MEREALLTRLAEISEEVRADPNYEANKAMFNACFDSHNPTPREPIGSPPMPDKIPTLDGSERELRDGDRVRLRCGIELSIESNGADLTDPECWWSGQCLCDKVEYEDVCWGHDGKSPAGVDGEYDIVMILGPAEETHADGTATKRVGKLKTIRVWGDEEDVDRVTEVRLRYIGGGRQLANECRNAAVTLRRKPAPHPPYEDRLYEACLAGTCQLPLHGESMTYSRTNESWTVHGMGCHAEWWPNLLGLLPKWTEGDPDTIDLAPVRARLEAK